MTQQSYYHHEEKEIQYSILSTTALSHDVQSSTIPPRAAWDPNKLARRYQGAAFLNPPPISGRRVGFYDQLFL